MLRWSSGYDACFTRRRSAVRSRHEVLFCSINPGSLLEPLHARKDLAVAAIAQLGERQTEDLEVPGSIPGLGIYFCLSHHRSFFARKLNDSRRGGLMV